MRSERNRQIYSLEMILEKQSLDYGAQDLPCDLQTKIKRGENEVIAVRYVRRKKRKPTDQLRNGGKRKISAIKKKQLLPFLQTTFLISL